MKYKTLGLLTILISCTLVHTPILKAQDPFDLKPLDPEIFVQTEQYLQQHRQQGKPWQTILEGVEFNRQSEIKIADEADVFTMLVRTGPSTAVLGYYTLDGELKWERNLDFSPMKPRIISHDLAYTGRKVLVSFIAFEDKNIKGVWDENGVEMTMKKPPNIKMAPSGNFFYDGNASFNQVIDLEIYNSNFKKVAITDLFPLLDIKEKKYTYRYKYKIIYDDILAIEITELEADTLNKKRFDIVDLKNNKILMDREFMNSRLYLKDTDIDLKENTMVIGFLDSENRKQGGSLNIFEVDLLTGRVQTHENLSYRSISLSNDGSMILTNNSYKTNGNMQYNFRLYDLRQREFIANIPEPIARDHIINFSVDDSLINVLSRAHLNNIPQLTSYALDKRRITTKINGWFKKDMEVGILPHQNLSNTTIRMIKVRNFKN